MGQTAQTGKISAIVQVQQDSVGANLVKISVLDPSYPVDVLKSQIEQIGIGAGSGARGIQLSDAAIDPAKPDTSRLLRATFAVDGLIDKKKAWLKPAPIIKALAGVPSPHQMDTIQVDFDFQRPTEQDLGDFSSPAVDVTRRMVDKTLEYTVHYKTQDASKVDVPDFATPAKTDANTRPTTSSGTDWLIVATIGIAAVAIGALVYCLFLLNPSYKKRYRP